MLADLDKRFDDPPRSFSPVPIWWWSGEKFDAQRLRWQLESFTDWRQPYWKPIPFDRIGSVTQLRAA